jgi:hypothetical protein
VWKWATYRPIILDGIQQQLNIDVMHDAFNSWKSPIGANKKQGGKYPIYKLQ